MLCAVKSTFIKPDFGGTRGILQCKGQLHGSEGKTSQTNLFSRPQNAEIESSQIGRHSACWQLRKAVRKKVRKINLERMTFPGVPIHPAEPFGEYDYTATGGCCVMWKTWLLLHIFAFRANNCTCQACSSRTAANLYSRTSTNFYSNINRYVLNLLYS